MDKQMQTKRLKCPKCGFVKATNVFKDSRFYCRECGRTLGIHKLKLTEGTEKESK